jgi:hypothetical protein
MRRFIFSFVCLSLIIISNSASFEQERIILEFIERLDEKNVVDLNHLKKYFDEDSSMRWTIPKNSDARRGFEEIKTHLSSWWKKTPDARSKVLDVTSKGNFIFVDALFIGTFPSGQKFEIPYFVKFSMRVDKIKHGVVYADFGSYFKGAGETTEL